MDVTEPSASAVGGKPSVQPSLLPSTLNFWLATRDVWISKALDAFGAWRSSEASALSKDFLAGKVATSAGLGQFLAACPPLSEEFLIAWDESSDVPHYVLTNHRLWVRNAKTGAHADNR